MAITEAEFRAAQPGDTPYNLINIADFNSLIAQSQRHSTPVFALSDEQIGQTGVIHETMKESRNAFRRSFYALANSVEVIAGLPVPERATD
jgi:chromosome partitioning protein